MASVLEDVLVAGAGMTPFGKFPDRGLKELASAAAAEALGDAKLAAADVDAVFFANATGGLVTGQEMIRGQTALRETGLLGIPIFNVENACASASSAFHLAWMSVACGQYEVALAIGAEKLVHPDKQRSFDALGAGIDLERRAELERFVYGGDGAPQGAAGSIFMDIYAELARRYASESGATAADFARVAVKNHRHGALNPKAQYRVEVTVEEVLGSRTVSDPITLLMCSPIGDGAAALVLCSPERARHSGADAVRVCGSALVSGTDDGPPAAVRAAQRAYEQAGFGPEDLDVVELHDAAAPAELQIYEELGLCAQGGGPALLASGDTELGGRVPVNPSGGLLSKGHPVGASGCAQLVELTDQLRGRAGARQVEGARTALAENAGGFLGPDHAAAGVTILSR
jgi:acetyl-CoA acetyltransferase